MLHFARFTAATYRRKRFAIPRGGALNGNISPARMRLFLRVFLRVFLSIHTNIKPLNFFFGLLKNRPFFLSRFSL